MPLNALYAELEAELSQLEGKFIAHYIPADPNHEPEAFEHDIKAYSLLAHAAFEEFVEAVSELLVSEVVRGMLSKKVSLSTISLLMSYRASIEIEEDESKDQDTVFKCVRKALDEAKNSHAKIIKDNHGFSLKYLRKILTPAGINVHDGPEVDAIRRLADARGSFAHTVARQAKYGEYRKVQAHKVFAPEDARNTVADCLKLCVKIRDQAAEIIL